MQSQPAIAALAMVAGNSSRYTVRAACHTGTLPTSRAALQPQVVEFRTQVHRTLLHEIGH